MTLIDKIQAASARRNASTKKLDDMIRTLLSNLEDVCEVGDGATVDGYRLELVTVRSNVAATNFWSFASRDGGDEGEPTAVYLDAGYGCERFLHGHFGAHVVGPSRVDLLEFGARADRFVTALLARVEGQAESAEKAAARAATSRWGSF